MMKKLIKDTPWGVIVAIVFLLAVWLLMWVMMPIVGSALTVGIGTILSIIRIAHYLAYGN
jgi:hypothetical protein